MNYSKNLKIKFNSKTLVFLIIVSASSNRINAQAMEWPVSYPRMVNNAPVVRGIIVLKKNSTRYRTYDSLNGFIKLLPYWPSFGSYMPILPYGDKWELKSVINVEIQDIAYIRIEKIYKYSFDSSARYTDFVNIDSLHLWRLIGRKNEVSLYDNMLGDMNSLFLKRMVLVSGNQPITVFTWASYNKHFGNIRQLLLNFIKRRYKIKLPETDFKSNMDLINVILDQENIHLKKSKIA
jgi:hypothetical protein